MMHFVITALWVTAQAECEYKDGTQFWSSSVFMNQFWAEYLVQEDVSDNTFNQQVESACSATYVMCPSINLAKMEILKNRPTCLLNSDCITAYETALKGETTTKEYYHDEIKHKFAYQLNPPVQTDDSSIVNNDLLQYQAANAHIAGIYGDSIFQNNGKYFTLQKSNSSKKTMLAQRTDKSSDRFAGPPVDLRMFVRNSELVPLNDDLYMSAWADFLVLALLGAGPHAGYTTAFKQRTLVSHSLSLCWSMILTGWNEQLPSQSTFVPNVVQPPLTTTASAQLWTNKCGKSCGLKPTNVNSKQMCSYGQSYSMLDNCKKNCLLDSECVGIYWGTQIDSNQHAYYVTKARPSQYELFMEAGAGYFSTFLELDRQASPKGLRFNREATTALLTLKLPSASNFVLADNASQEIVTPHSVFTPKRCTDDPSAVQCLVFKNEGTFIAYADGNEAATPNGTAVRTYQRVTSNTAGKCEAHCMTDGFCLAWTFDEDGCSIDRSIGSVGTVGRPPNLAALTEMGLDPAFGCPDSDHAWDLCSAKCVNIHSNLEMGWCNHPWVLCQAGKYKDVVTVEGNGDDDDDSTASKGNDRLCVGGAMPDLDKAAVDPSKEKGYEAYRFTPQTAQCDAASTYKTMPNACKQAQVESRTAMAILSKEDVKLTGLYRATACGTVGAGPTAQPKDGETAYDNWLDWTKKVVGQDDASRKEYLAASNNLKLPAEMPTNTYVTASSGFSGTATSQTRATPFASSTSGVHGNRHDSSVFSSGDCQYKGKSQACLFPTCIISPGQSSRGVTLYEAIDPVSSSICDSTPDIKTEFKTALKAAQILPPATCRGGCSFGDGKNYILIPEKQQYWSGTLHYTTESVNTCSTKDKNMQWVKKGVAIEAFSKFETAIGAKKDSCETTVKVPNMDMKYCPANHCMLTEMTTVTTINGNAFTNSKGTCKVQLNTMDGGQSNQPCTSQVNLPGFGTVTVDFSKQESAEDYSQTQNPFNQQIKCRAGVQSTAYSCSPQFGDYEESIQGNPNIEDQIVHQELLRAGRCNHLWEKGLGKYYLDKLTPKYLEKNYANKMAQTTTDDISLVQAQVFRVSNPESKPFLKYGSSANPDPNDIAPEGQFAEYANDYGPSTGAQTTYLPSGLTNAANTGLMCPVGIVIPATDGHMPTEDQIDTDPMSIQHPYAQLTAKCPSNKPYRCSHMTMQKPAGGTCEYGYNWNTQKALFTSGAGSYRDQMLRRFQSNNTATQDNTEYDKIDIVEQLAKNAQCHLYDFGCYTENDAHQYSVCGIPSDSSSTAAGGYLCGTNPDQKGTEGFCGIKVDSSNNVDGVPKDKVVPVTLQEAYEMCSKPPNKEPICPIGFVLQWHAQGAGASASCMPIAKASKPASRVDKNVAKAFMMPKLSKIRPRNNPFRESVLCKTDSVWNEDIGCLPILCEHRSSEQRCIAPVLMAPADNSYPENICAWSNTNASCFVNNTYRHIQDLGVHGISQEAKFSKFYWPGFQRVTNKPSFAGVGPAYAYSATSCGEQSQNCQGFAYCNNKASTTNNCLDSTEMVEACCQTPQGALGVADTFTQFTGTNCEIAPSTMCAGGNHMFMNNDQHDQSTCDKSKSENFISQVPNDGSPQMCECCINSCKTNTVFVSAQTDLRVEASSKAGSSVQLKELFGVLVDITDSANPTTINANSCLGPDNRLQGASWNGDETACACRVDAASVTLNSALKLPFYVSKPDLKVSSYCSDKSNSGTCIGIQENDNTMYQTTPPAMYSCDFDAAQIAYPERPFTLIHANYTFEAWAESPSYEPPGGRRLMERMKERAGTLRRRGSIEARRLKAALQAKNDPAPTPSPTPLYWSCNDGMNNRASDYRCVKTAKFYSETDYDSNFDTIYHDSEEICQSRCKRPTPSPPTQFPTPFPTPFPTQYPTPAPTPPTPSPTPYDPIVNDAVTDKFGNKKCPLGTIYTGGESTSAFQGCTTECCKKKSNNMCQKNQCFRQFMYDKTYDITVGQCRPAVVVNRDTKIKSLPQGASLYPSAQKQTFCDPSESCAYTTRVRTALDAFVPVDFGLGAVQPTQLLTYDSESYNVYRTVEEVNNACIMKGKSCTGYAMLEPPSKRPLAVMFLTPENQVGQQYRGSTVPGMQQLNASFVYKRTTTEKRPDWDQVAYETQVNEYTYTRTITIIEAVSTHSIINYCAAVEDCRQVLWSEQEFVLAFDAESANKTGLGYDFALQTPVNVLTKKPVNGSCNLLQPYAYDLDGNIGSGCCSSPDISSTGTFTNYIIDNCPGTSSKCIAPPCQNQPSYSTCPKHQACLHGESLLDPKIGQCSCFCNGQFMGRDCSVCLKKNTQAPDCKTCKSNFVEDEELCVCKNGYDIATQCTKCLPFFAGEDCRTNTCQYFLGKGSTATQQGNRPGKVVFKNSVIARAYTGVLYDGIHAAGDGSVPYTMQNSFALQDKQLYWIGSHYGVHTKQRVQNTAVCKHWNNASWLLHQDTEAQCVDGTYMKDCKRLYVCNKGRILPIMDRPAVASHLQWTTDTQAQNHASGTVLHTCTKAGYKIVPTSDDIKNKCFSEPKSGDFLIDKTEDVLLKEPDLHSIIHYLSGGWLNSIPTYGKSPVTFKNLTSSTRTRGAVCVDPPNTRDAALREFINTNGASDALLKGFSTPTQTPSQELLAPEAAHDSEEQRCADLCADSGPVKCSVFVWQIFADTSQCYHFSQTHVLNPNFPSSVYNVQPGVCASGGIYGTGEWRNNPNKPEFSVPKYEDTLTPVDPALQNTLVCSWDAQDSDTTYFLSEYRRHAWASTNCSSRFVNRIDSNWLMSLPRGTPMDKTHARAAPGGTVRAFNSFTQTTLTAHGQLATTASDATACGLRCKEGCNYWFYGSPNWCILSPYVPETAVEVSEYLDVESWGGSAIAAVNTAGSSLPLSCKGEAYGTRINASAVCFYNTVYAEDKYQIDDALIMKSLALKDHPYLDLPNRFALTLGNHHFADGSEHSASGCCKTCSERGSSVCHYAAGLCKCYNAITLQHSDPITVQLCWARTNTVRCNSEIHFVVFPGQLPNKRLTPLFNDKGTVETAQECKLRCLDEQRCLSAAVTNNLECTLYTYAGDGIITNDLYQMSGQSSNVTTYQKQGGCLSVANGINSYCQYDMGTPLLQGAHRTDHSSANGAIFAFATDVHMFYGRTSAAASVQVGEDNDCTAGSTAYVTHGLSGSLGLAIPNLVFLKYIADSIAKDKAIQVTGAQFLYRSTTAPFTVAKHLRQAVSNSMHEFSIHANDQRSFMITQSYAFSVSPGLTPSACQKQADLASALVGETADRAVAECTLASACTADLSSTESFDNVRNMYVEQSRVCMKQLGQQPDPLHNVPTITYIQPPVLSGFSAYTYQGMPIYAPNDPYLQNIDSQQTSDSEWYHQWFGSVATRPGESPTPRPTPEPLPTPPPAFMYNSTMQNGTLHTSGGGTYGNCIYTKFWRSVVQDTSINARLFQFDKATYKNYTDNCDNLKTCANLCNTFLLCRLVTYTDHCAMYGATETGQNLENAVVSETNDGCRLQDLFFSQAVTTIGDITLPAQMAVKNNCCFARFPENDEVLSSAPTPAPAIGP